MLKALELYGFKSFADRTRFDFPDGITVVVGPNGSGKSNIVDGIKWVLGSQSAKSLRGKEMADVIFKGSTDRKPAGAAEASIFFDNSQGTLPYDAEEVQVTRRVYRSGESEYLINGSPVRLKDVKDLVRGTGIGIDAYSLIEQGKVDRMLQANPKDRRAIFEEAAGISRFKVKKVEAERRLARVQQNLRRLGDIVDEVRGRLESLRSQASKAERYRLASERLKELRTQLAWADWQQFTALYAETEASLEERRQSLRDIEGELAEAVEQRQAADLQLQGVAQRAAEVETTRTEIVRKIAGLLGSLEADQRSAIDLQRQIDSGRRRLKLLRGQAGSAVAELRDLVVRHRDAVKQLTSAVSENSDAEKLRDEANEEVDAVRRRRDAIQSEHLDSLRTAADLEGNQQRFQQQIDASTRQLDALAVRVEAAKAAVAEAIEEVERCESRIGDLDFKIESTAIAMASQEADLNEQKRLLDRRREEASALRIRLQGIRERVNLLEDLGRRQEGVSSGVKGLMEAAGSANTGPLSDIVALVADVIETDVHVAPLIDVALGNLSQYIIVRGDSLQRAILSGGQGLAGRIGLIRLDELPSRRPGDRIRLDGLKGVVGRADRLVRVKPQFEPLARHLLSTTWLVDTMHTALGLRKLSGAGLRFVTGGCELLERDGSVMLGPASAASGLVSRRSELAAAQREMNHYRYQLDENEREAQRLIGVVDSHEATLGRISRDHRDSITLRAGAVATRDAAIEREQARRNSLEDLIQQEHDLVISRDTANGELEKVADNLMRCRRRIAGLDDDSREVARELGEKQSRLRSATDAVMQRSVELARIEQRVEALQATLDQQKRDQSQRDEAVAEVRSQLDQDVGRMETVQLRMLANTGLSAELHLEHESLQRLLRDMASELASLRERQRKTQKQSESANAKMQRAAEAVREIERKRDSAQVQRQSLADRILEDYEIDLQKDEPPGNFSPPENRQAVDDEIAQLRQQLQRTGAVNMEALEELQSLQHRFDTLSGQYQDLTSAKESLERIIQKINVDSRRLFMDTLEAIRQNFQVLYRKSFGGGSADLILEDDADPLEAGVEIVATPPGKPSFSNSLLSGGEKALTAVALLMAIFQYRPSPFCVLDEVDAPFDEANIGRFVTVLTEFLSQTKFVVVTHSKKTMTAANTLYGVTMQESGVSKQVSVRFEDVDEDGQIQSQAA